MCHFGGVPAAARWAALLVCCALTLACATPTETSAFDDGADLVETHRGILDGTVRGAVNQPLENVEVIVDFEDSNLPAPSTRTDGAGRFEFVLAIYNGGESASDSANATVIAIARTSSGTVEAATHVDTMVRFRRLPQQPPRTTVSLTLNVF